MKQNAHLFIVASFSAQSEMGNYMACKRSEMSTYIRQNGIDLLFVSETWLSAQGDKAKIVELSQSGLLTISLPRQSRLRINGIAAMYKSNRGCNITLKTNLDFTHTSFEVVLALISLSRCTLHFICLYSQPTHRRNSFSDTMFT